MTPAEEIRARLAAALSAALAIAEEALAEADARCKSIASNDGDDQAYMDANTERYIAWSLVGELKGRVEQVSP